jgi:Rieske Fe-S protein
LQIAMSDDRRGFLKRLVLFASGLFGAALALPAAGYLGDPLRRGKRSAGFVRVTSIDALTDGAPVKVEVVATAVDAWIRSPARRIGAAWLLRSGDSVRAWTVVCPHLGCAVDYRSEANRFVCPCHDSAFDGAGRRISGPSPRGMDPLDVEVRGRDVFVRLVRFEKGTRERRVT